MRLRPLAVPMGPAVLDVLPDLERALAGGAPVLPFPAASAPPAVPGALHERDDLPDDTALVIGTSGSTGTPKLAVLTTSALVASSSATHDVLGGAGRWLLTMPAHHIAGLQVLLRSLAAGTTPVVVDLASGFTPAAFAAASRHVTGGRAYTALVPTQLSRLLADEEGRAAAAAYAAVLVGGANTPVPLRDTAADAGLHVVTTYGMSETAGGCVYAGRPLPCSSARVDEDGRVLLGGATLASGYLGRPDLTEAAFLTEEDGARWFRTDDVGRLAADGVLHIDGRVDDVINTGGLKVVPRAVEEAVLAHVPGVREAVVVGTTDPQWGQAVSLAVVALGPLSVDTVREALRPHLPRHALPTRLLVLDALPLTGPGKPDRAALVARFPMGG